MSGKKEKPEAELVNERVPWAGETDSFIPSHVSTWSEDKKKLYSNYVERQESKEDPSIIREGQEYILKHSKGSAFFSIKKGKKWKAKGVTLESTKLIGEHVECTYEVQKGSIKRKKLEVSDLNNIDMNFKVTSNNSELVDNSKNQALTDTDIQALKKQKTGTEIVNMLVSNSATFDNKTEFSKEKYLKRKKKKYDNDLCIQRPSLDRIIPISLLKHGKKVMCIREDTIAHILTTANVRAGCRTLVCESTKGLLTAAMAERMGGMGHLFCLTDGPSPQMQICTRLQLSSDVKSVIHPFPIYLVQPLLEGQGIEEEAKEEAKKQTEKEEDSKMKQEQTQEENKEKTQDEGEKQQKQQKEEMEEMKAKQEGTETTVKQSEGESGNGEKGERKGRNGLSRQENRRLGLLNQLRHVRNSWDAAGGSVESIVLASKYNVLELVKGVWQLLMPGGVIVIYSQSIQQLADCMDWLKKRDMVCNPELLDIWYRIHQVLPNRTHPMMNMSATGGYMLSAIKLAK